MHFASSAVLIGAIAVLTGGNRLDFAAAPTALNGHLLHGSPGTPPTSMAIGHMLYICAMSGTEIAYDARCGTDLLYGATGLLRNARCYAIPGTDSTLSCYAMSGTDRGCAATREPRCSRRQGAR
eukprot:3929328-Rhodomonas_salina.2